MEFCFSNSEDAELFEVLSITVYKVMKGYETKYHGKIKAPSGKWMEHCSYYGSNLDGHVVFSGRNFRLDVRVSLLTQPISGTFFSKSGGFSAVRLWLF